MAHSGYFSHEISLTRKPGAIDILIRSSLFIAVFLSLLFSFHPFPSLSDPAEVAATGDLANQIGYTSLFLLLACWTLTHQPQRLLLLVRPILVATLLWFALTVAFSWDPALSARRFAYALVTIGISAMVLLLPRNPRHFGDVMTLIAGIVLAACYLGVLLKPGLTIHQASDMVEPELAGDWRGIFGHKNEASVAMVVFIFLGLYAIQMRNFARGAILIALSVPFLYMTHSKTAIAALPLAYLISLAITRTRLATGIALALGVVVALNVFSIGSIYWEPVRDVVDTLMSDPTFTGRTAIWKFAVSHVAERPIIGYGFSAFWGTEQVVYGMAENGWTSTVSHAHNGYLDLALTVGIPGSVLTSLWLFVLPLVDYYRAQQGVDNAPLRMLFLRICLFAAYESCFETIFTEVGALWLILFAAAFGLRYAAVSRISS